MKKLDLVAGTRTGESTMGPWLEYDEDNDVMYCSWCQKHVVTYARTDGLQVVLISWSNTALISP